MNKRFINIVGEVLDTPDFKEVTWRPSAYAIVKNEEGRVLAMRLRADGKLCLPGGGAEIQESLEECVSREVWEETGYRVKAEGDPIHITENMFFNELKNTFHHTLAFFYRGTVTDDSEGGQIFDKKDSVGVEWVELEETKEEDWNQWYWPVVKKIIDGEIVV